MEIPENALEIKFYSNFECKYFENRKENIERMKNIQQNIHMHVYTYRWNIKKQAIF